MLSIRSSADMDRALDGPMDPQLRRLLTLRRDQLLANVNIDLGDVAHIIVAFRSDTLATVEAEAGFSLTGSDAAVEWVERHPCRWVEVVAILTDDFAVAIFVPDCVTTDPDLLLALLARV